ncbi:type II toxin-antitoxin system Phd/YefM family antitoxin [Nocardia sp. NPDC052566]|uniref:type II toxin-antitoxin system Phd/YefM family antitoxin n=1 Tax=Nocardia sp. NPDC052566 TaxID=3364330 RepID=UPI0037CB6DAC
MPSSRTTYGLRDLRERVGDIVRGVAATGCEVVVTDSGSEIAVIISMADYERLHEHADVADALRLRTIATSPETSIPLADMLDELGVQPTDVIAS